MGRELTLPSMRLCAAAALAAVPLYSGENKPYSAIDVGCDHAKLAIYLVQSGVCSHVTASDINDGPVEKARQNVKNRTLMGKSLAEYIDVVKNDGLCGFENIDANRIFILGMGGELIADILERADFLRDEKHRGKIRFILQPMTSEDRLRVYLYTNGYNIDDEEIVEDKDRIYAVMSVVYDGVKRSGALAQYLLGQKNIEKGGELFLRQLNRRLRIAKKALEDRKKASLDSKELSELVSQLECILKEWEK